MATFRPRGARRSAAILLGLAAAGWAVALHSPVAVADGTPFFLDARAAWTRETNLNRAERHAFQENDSHFELDATLGYRRQVTGNSGLIARLALEADAFAEFSDLDSLTGRAALTWLLQPRRGFTAPWYSLTASMAVTEHEASPIRDGTQAAVTLAAGKRFTDRLSGRIHYTYRDRDASSGRVFEATHHLAGLHAEHRATSRLDVYLDYEYLSGALVTIAPAWPRFMGVTRAVTMDPVFGLPAWRLDGDAHTLGVGAELNLSRRTGIDIGLRHSLARADNDNQWNRWRFGFSVVHRFR